MPSAQSLEKGGQCVGSLKRQSRSADAVDEVEVIEVFGGCFPPFRTGTQVFYKTFEKSKGQKKDNVRIKYWR